jgi:peptide/nickel transport system permease protein
VSTDVGTPTAVEGLARPSSGARGRRLARSLLTGVGKAVAVAFGVVTITFLLIHLIPGDPARQVLGQQASQETVDALREQLHLNEPILSQYGHFLGQLVQGDLGESISQTNRTVVSIITEGLDVTLVLIAMTMAFSSFVGITIGLWAGTTRSRALDGVIRLGSMIGLGTPPFFLGAVLILLVSLDLGLAPAAGTGSGFPDTFRYLWLPMLALSALYIPILARAVRQRARVVMGEQFVEAALARGISRRRLIYSHVLPNSALPAITLIGLNAGLLLSSAVVVETMFGLSGLGSSLLAAVEARDYPVIQGIAVVAGLFVVLCNLLADAAMQLTDPRARA